MASERTTGEFCRVLGNNPRNKILEFFLEMKGLDFSRGDLAKETNLNRATTYNTIDSLIKKGFITPTRKVSGSQLYKLNTENSEVKILVKIFNLILENAANKIKVEVKTLNIQKEIN